MGQDLPVPADAPAALSDLTLLPRRVYRLRMLGFGLAMAPIAAVLLEHQAPPAYWAWLVFTGIAWPQLAMLLARQSRDPFRAEVRNLLVDSALAGIWVPLLRFDLLPSALLVTLATVDKIHTGIRGLWLWSLPGMVAGGLGAAWLTGFAADVETSLPVMLACLPMLLIHTIAASLASYRLVRKVQRQNRRLDELSRMDVLTGLSGRRHFEQRATAAEAGATAERIRNEVAAIVLPHLPGVATSVSLGLAPACDGDIGLREWLESADRALYRAKSGGRNRVTTHDGDFIPAAG